MAGAIGIGDKATKRPAALVALRVPRVMKLIAMARRVPEKYASHFTCWRCVGVPLRARKKSDDALARTVANSRTKANPAAFTGPVSHCGAPTGFRIEWNESRGPGPNANEMTTR